MFWGVLWLSKMCVVPELWLLTCKPVPCERRRSFIRIWDFRNFYSLLKALPPLLMKWKWKVHVLVAQLCPTVCDPMVCGPPGSSPPRDPTHVSCFGRRNFFPHRVGEIQRNVTGKNWGFGNKEVGMGMVGGRFSIPPAFVLKILTGPSSLEVLKEPTEQKQNPDKPYWCSEQFLPKETLILKVKKC